MEAVEITKEEKSRQYKKRLEIAKKYQENPFEIPDFMMKDFIYSESIKEAKHLIPKKSLIKKAFKKTVQQYIDFVNGKEIKTYRNRYFVYNFIEVKDRSVLYWEFVYYRDHSDFNRDNFTHERNQFTLTEAIDFKKKIGLMNERKNYTGMGGYRYKVTYDSFITQYKLNSLKTPGSVWSGEKEYHKSFKKLKINDYFTLDTTSKIKNWYMDYCWFQKILNQDPGITEVLFKMGYENLVDRSLSRQKYDFLRKNKKSIPKNITKEELDLMYSIHKSGNDPKDYIMIMDTFGLNFFGKSTKYGGYGLYINSFPYELYDLKKVKEDPKGNRYYDTDKTKTSFSSVNAKVLYRVINLLNTGSTWGELNHFAGCCHALGINQNEYIFKGRKEREAIAKEFDRQKKEIKHNFVVLEREKKKKLILSLEEVTNSFKEIKTANFTFVPLKTFKDFQETAKKFRNCLITNEFHLKVSKQQRIIYIAVPVGRKETEGEIVAWNVEGTENKKISINQINGVQNKNTIFYEEIKKIATSLTYNDIVQKQI
jgi:hypothetical protein